MTIKEIENKISPALKQYHVRKALHFGSIVRGETTEESDIDLLVELPETASLLYLAGLKIYLEELLGKNVDVLTYDSLPPLIKDRILEEQVVIL